MRGILRSPVLPHFVVLAIPVVAIGYAVLSGSQLRAASWFDMATTVSASIGLLPLAICGYMIWAPNRKPQDQHALTRLATIGLFGVDLLVDAFSFLLAIGSPAGGLLISVIAAAWLILWSSSSLRRVRLSSSYTVKRSPEVVFAFVSDYRNLPRYRPEYESVEMLTTGPIGPGTQFRELGRLLDGTKIVAVEAIIDFKPNERVTFSVVGLSDRSFDEFTFVSALNTTRVTHRYDYELPFSNAALGGWFLVRHQRDSLLAAREAGQIRVKQILEDRAFEMAPS